MAPRLALLFLALSACLRAGSFDLKASLDRDSLELGDSLRLELKLNLRGQMEFPPQLEPPSFPGFEARGPMQGQSIRWVNGDLRVEQTWTWELVAQKSGALKLGPFKALGKDARLGEISRSTPALRVQVRRPRGLALPGFQGPAPAPTEEALADIKPDQALPWWVWAAPAGLALLAAGLLLWWRRRPAPGPAPEAPPADPGGLALERLELAWQRLLPGGEAAYAAGVAAALRDYLRWRLELRPGATLGEALGEARRRRPGPWLEREEALRLDLSLALYGDLAPSAQDCAGIRQAARELVQDMERARGSRAGQGEARPAQGGRKNPKRKG